MTSTTTGLRSRTWVLGAGLELFERYAPAAPGELDDDTRAMVLAQAPKRVALEFVETRRVSWDHRKLGGGY